MFDIVPILTQAAQQMVFEEEAIKFVAFINWPSNLVVNLFASPDVSPVIIEQETSQSFINAWFLLLEEFQKELDLGTEVHLISVESRNRNFIIAPLDDNSIIIYSTVDQEINELLESLLKYSFKEISDVYTTVGLVSSDGVPRWALGTDDEYLFAMGIITLLSLIERIDMEVDSGGVNDCLIVSDQKTKLNIQFNKTEDLALAITQKHTEIDSFTIIPELLKIFRKINDPSIFQSKIPTLEDEERDKILEELLVEYEGDVEEELQTLSAFDEELMSTLEKEIKTLQRRFRVNMISIGYLRKRLRLPPEVLRMLIEYLVNMGIINARIGKTKSGEVLVLQKSEDPEQSKRLTEVNEIIKSVMLKVDTIFPTREIEEIPTIEIVEEEETGLDAFQVLISVADSEPLYLLSSDIRKVANQFSYAIKSYNTIKKQLERSWDSDDDLIQEKLMSQLETSEKSYLDLQQQITIKVNQFYTDLRNYYQLLFQIIPIPQTMGAKPKGRGRKKRRIYFDCFKDHSTTDYFLLDFSRNWLLLAYFGQEILGIKTPFIKKVELQHLNDIKKSIETIDSIINQTEIPLSTETIRLTSQLNKLLISNDERDQIVSTLRFVNYKNTTCNIYDVLKYCKSCKKWYCLRHMKDDNVCVNC